MRPVPNLQAPITGIGKLANRLIPPWNSWFQQFSQQAPASVNIITTPYTPNEIGNVIIQGAVTITLTRGSVNFNLTGEQIIPLGIGDTLSWTGPATVSFLG